jgi:hypothetical protein
VRIAENAINDTSYEGEMGNLVPFSCPECGGPLREKQNAEILRYRCHTGHAYTARTLLSHQSEAVEYALWRAVSVMEERANMLMNMARRERERGRNRSAAIYEERASEIRTHAQSIKELLRGEVNYDRSTG